MKEPAQKKTKKITSKRKQKTLSISWKNFFQFFFMISVWLFIIGSLATVTVGEAHAANNNQQINFQGKIVNKTSGTNITDGTYSFTFKIYDASSGGNQLWSETQSSVTVTNGIFQVALGSVTPLSSLNFTNPNLWLDITFNGETFGSRIQLGAVPTAIDALNLDGVVATQSASGFDLTGGTSTVSTVSFTTSGSTLTVKPGNTGSLTLQSNGANGLTLDTGGAASITIGASANSITIGNSTSSNNTAITLTTGGSGVLTLGSNTGTGNVVVNPNAGGQAALVVNNFGAGDIFTASSSSQTKFVISNAGDVGIGTKSPSAGLDIAVNGAASTPGLQLDGTWYSGGDATTTKPQLLVEPSGTTSNNWSTSGTALGVNAPSGFGGDLFNYEINGLSYLHAFKDSSDNNALDLRQEQGTLWLYAAYTMHLYANGGPLYLRSGAGGTLVANSNGSTVYDFFGGEGDNGLVGLGTGSPIAALQVTHSLSNFTATGKALAIFDQTENQDIFTASASGVTKFTIGNSGALTDVNYAGANAVLYAAPTTGVITGLTTTTGSLCLLSQAGSSGTPVWGSCAGSSGSLQGAYNAGQTIDLSQTGTGLTIGTNAGTQNVVISPNAGGQAALVVNDQGLGDIFTASASGNTKFTVAHSGLTTIDGALTLIGGSATAGTFTTPGGSSVPTKINVPVYDPGAFGQIIAMGVPSSAQSTVRVLSLFDARSSSHQPTLAVFSPDETQVAGLSWEGSNSDIFLKNSLAGGNTYISFGGTTDVGFNSSIGMNVWKGYGPAINAGTLNTQTTLYIGAGGSTPNAASFAWGDGTGWKLNFGYTNGAFVPTFSFEDTGRLGIGTTSLQSTLDVSADRYTTPVAYLSGATGKATLVIDQSGVGDILTASASGATKFTIKSDGTIVSSKYTTSNGLLYTDNTGAVQQVSTGSSGDCLTAGINGAISWGSCATGGGGSGSLQQAYNVGQAIDLSQAGSGLTLGTGLGDQNVVISPNAGGQAALVINDQGLGDIFTASASGSTKFTVARSGLTTINGALVLTGGSSTATTTSTPQGSSVPTKIDVPVYDPGAFGQVVAMGLPSSAASSARVLSLFDARSSSHQPTLSVFTPDENNVAGLSWEGSNSDIALKNSNSSGTISMNINGNAEFVVDSSGNADVKNLSVASTTAVCYQSVTVNGASVNQLTDCNGTPTDLAENYGTSDPTIEAGDVVAASGEAAEVTVNGTTSSKAFIKKASQPYETDVLGVVSTLPNQLYGDDGLFTPSENPRPVSLAGRVPVKVSTENGPIAVGDYLTTSSIPGVAMKATKAGITIGKALSSYKGTGIGKVFVYVHTGYFTGAPVLVNGLNSNDMNDAELSLLSNLVAQSKPDAVNLSEITTDKLVAGIEVVSPTVITDTLIAHHIKADQIDGLQEALASISADLQATESSLVVPAGALTVDTIFINNTATVSGSLRVKGNGLVEGVLSVIDTLRTSNLIVSKVADFFDTVIFHDGVQFVSAPLFSKDTAGFAVIHKGSQSVSLTFANTYAQTPIIQASLTTHTTRNATTSAQTVLNEGYSYVITNESPQGFTIILSKEAGEDVYFSWMALAVDKPVLFESKSTSTVLGTQITPTPNLLHTISSSSSAENQSQ